MKFKMALFLTLLFTALLFGFYYVHITFFKVDVVLYSAIADGGLAALVAGLILSKTKKYRIFSRFEKSQMIIIWLLVGGLFALAIPTVIDRSLSFFILEKLHQRGGGIRRDSFEEMLIQEYMKEHRLVDVRLTEQQESGTIIIENGCIKLTERGEKLVTFSRFFRLHLLPRQRLLMGEYSDDLIDPFRNSVVSPGYECQ